MSGVAAAHHSRACLSNGVASTTQPGPRCLATAKARAVEPVAEPILYAMTAAFHCRMRSRASMPTTSTAKVAVALMQA